MTWLLSFLLGILFQIVMITLCVFIGGTEQSIKFLEKHFNNWYWKICLLITFIFGLIIHYILFGV